MPLLSVLGMKVSTQVPFIPATLPDLKKQKPHSTVFMHPFCLAAVEVCEKLRPSTRYILPIPHALAALHP